MGIIELDSGEYQAICGDCGVALCWTMSLYDYLEQKDYWDNWNCEKCDPEYFNRWRLTYREKAWASAHKPVIRTENLS
jgi:hypothetical protein